MREGGSYLVQPDGTEVLLERTQDKQADPVAVAAEEEKGSNDGEAVG